MKDDRVYLLHIEECLAEIDSFVQGSRELFLNNKLVRNATLRSLQTLAESTTRLSDANTLQFRGEKFTDLET